MKESNVLWLERIEYALLEARAFFDCLELEEELVKQDNFLQSIKRDTDNAWLNVKEILKKYPSVLEDPEEKGISPVVKNWLEEGIPF